MKVQILCSVLILLGVVSYAQAVNIKSGSGSYQPVKSSQQDNLSLAQTNSLISIEQQVDIEGSSQSEQFIIDDFLTWIWCRITNCEKKPEAPEEKKAPKESPKIVIVEETKAEPKAANKSNATNVTEEAKPERTPAPKQEKPQPKKDGPQEAPPADTTKQVAEPAPLPSDEDLSKQIKDRKDKQSAEMNAGGVGDKESKKSQTAGVPESNPMRDDGKTAEALLASKAQKAKNQLAVAVASKQSPESPTISEKVLSTPKIQNKQVSSKFQQPLKVEVPKGRSVLHNEFDDDSDN